MSRINERSHMLRKVVLSYSPVPRYRLWYINLFNDINTKRVLPLSIETQERERDTPSGLMNTGSVAGNMFLKPIPYSMLGNWPTFFHHVSGSDILSCSWFTAKIVGPGHSTHRGTRVRSSWDRNSHGDKFELISYGMNYNIPVTPNKGGTGKETGSEADVKDMGVVINHQPNSKNICKQRSFVCFFFSARL